MTTLKPMLLALAALTAAPTFAEVRTYDLLVQEQRREVVPGRLDTVITMNGTVPGPVLRFTEGDQAVIRVTNRLKQSTSIHWHGLLVPGDQDGAAGFNAFTAIEPGQTFTYRFPIRQNGTYWYHAHGIEEQAGQYAAFIIDPKGADPIRADRDYVVLLSEHTRERPERIIRNLKADAGYYNFSKRTLPQFFADARKFGLGRALADRKTWGEMRMDPTDIADVGNYTLLATGLPTQARPSFRFTPGERVRLRFINGSAMSFMDVRAPGLTMTVVAADGKRVEPVAVDEFRIGVAETYDVIVEPTEDRAYAIFAETIDRKASVLATLAPRDGLVAQAPPPRPRPVLLASEMGHAMSGGMMMGGTTPAAPDGAHARHAMRTAAAGSGGGAMAAMPGMAGMQGTAAADPTCPPEHAAMGHCTPKTAAPQAAPAPAAPADPTCPPEHAAMGHCTPRPAAASPPAPSAPLTPADPACPPEHAAMGHCTPKPAAPPAAAPSSAPRAGSAVALAARPEGDTPFPKVDYGFGSDPMAGMDHAAMGHDMGGMNMAALGREGDTDGSGRVFGWATGAPYGARVLSVRDLASAEPQRDTRAPARTIVVRITGNMERYIWTLNGAKFGEAPPIRVRFGERVRITFVNETMMAHPMHLHGMFFEVENGQPLDRLPSKTVIAVAPGKTQSILLTANEAGEWPLHCHLLYHMESGMMQKLVVASVDNPDGTPAAPGAGGHGGHGAMR